MANEIAFSAMLSFAKAGAAAKLEPGEIRATLAGKVYFFGKQSVDTTEEALKLGDVNPAGGMYLIWNQGPTNYVLLKPQAGGTATTVINAGEVALGRFQNGITAPFVQANTAAVDIVFLLLPA